MNKQITSALLSFALIIGMAAAVVPAWAAAGSGLSLSASEVSPGDEFTVTAAVPPIEEKCSNVEMKVEYDKAVFEIVRYEPEPLKDSDFMYSLPNEANGAGSFVCIQGGLMGDNTIDVSRGYAVTAVFKVKEEAPAGEYTFNASRLTAEKINEETGQPITLMPDGSIRQVTLTVKGSTGESPAGHTHTAGSEWKYDADEHWNECSCGEKLNRAAHILGEWVITREAAAEEKGSRERICSVCGYKETGDIPAAGEVVTMISSAASETGSPESSAGENAGSSAAGTSEGSSAVERSESSTGSSAAGTSEGSAVGSPESSAVEVPESGAAGSSGSSHIGLWIALVLAGGGAAGAVLYSRRKKTDRTGK